MRVMAPSSELNYFLDQSSKPVEDAMFALGKAILLNDPATYHGSLRALQKELGDAMSLADLYGRRRLLREADNVSSRNPRNAVGELILLSAEPVFPNVSFVDAARDLVRREPRLKDGYKAVQEAYRSGHTFALARSSDITLTRKIQKILAGFVKDGGDTNDLTEVIARLGGWTKSYSDTVVRTNLASAYTAGRFQQAFDPAMANIIGAFEFSAVNDSATRPNHAATHMLTAHQSDPIWRVFAPPQGYNCRCALSLVDRWELQERGLIVGNKVKRFIPPGFAGAHPDKGFGGKRPDLEIYRRG